MIDINLVRRRIEPLPRGIERLSPVLVFILIFIYAFTAALIYGWSLHLRQSGKPLAKKVAIQKKLYEPSGRYPSGFWERYRELSVLLEEARLITRTKRDCSGALAVIAEKCPPDVVLNSIELTPSTLRAHGRTRGSGKEALQSIEQFIHNLHSTGRPLLAGAELRNYSFADRDSRSDGYVFLIRGSP